MKMSRKILAKGTNCPLVSDQILAQTLRDDTKNGCVAD